MNKSQIVHEKYTNMEYVSHIKLFQIRTKTPTKPNTSPLIQKKNVQYCLLPECIPMRIARLSVGI